MNQEGLQKGEGGSKSSQRAKRHHAGHAPLYHLQQLIFTTIANYRGEELLLNVLSRLLKVQCTYGYRTELDSYRVFLLLYVHPEMDTKGMPVQTCQGRGDSGGAHETYQSASVAAFQQLLGDDVEGFR